MAVCEGVSELPEPVADRAIGLDDRVVLLETQAGFPSSHSLLVADGRETVLLDAGVGEAVLEQLAGRLDRVVLTHFHLDHVLGAPLVDGPPLVVPEAERAVFEGQPFPAFAGTRPEVAERFEAAFGDVYPSFEADPETFAPGDELELAGTRWEVVPAPGHSPGHALFHETERSILFSVDVEFSGMGPWYAWPHCDPTAFQRSIEAARGRFEQAEVVANSHSPTILDDRPAVEAALDAFLACFADRDEALAGVLEDRAPGTVTLDELVDEVRLFYGDHVDKNAATRYWCRVMTSKHLERLADQGRAVRDGEGWRALDAAGG